MPNIFFYILTVGFASGIFARSFFDLGIAWILFFLTVGFGCALVWRIKAFGFYSPLFLVSLMFLSVALGVFRFDVSDTTESKLSLYEGASVVLTGTVVREPDIHANTVHLYMREADTEELLLVIADRFPPYAYGDVIEVQGTLKVPESFETDLGRTFNYEGYLRARGVQYTIPFAKVLVHAHDSGNPFISYLYKGKQAFLSALEGTMPEPAAGLGEGLLLGVKRALGDDLELIFRQVGIIHIIVLSGYNIMIVVDSIMRLLAYIFGPRMRMLIGLCVIVTFALLVGLSATVVRASIMAGLVLIARGTGKTNAVLRTLMFAGVVMLVINPYLLAFDPGFQLSFLATLGLILLAPRIDARLSSVPSIFGIREFLTATLATQIFVLPVLLYQMGMLSLVAVIANVLVLPAVPYAMLLVFVTGVSSFLFEGLALFVGFIAYVLLSYIVIVAEFLSSVPYASVSVPTFPFWVVIASYALLALILVYGGRKKGDIVHPSIVPLNQYEDWVITDDSEISSGEKVGKEGVHELPFR